MDENKKKLGNRGIENERENGASERASGFGTVLRGTATGNRFGDDEGRAHHDEAKSKSPRYNRLYRGAMKKYMYPYV